MGRFALFFATGGLLALIILGGTILGTAPRPAAPPAAPGGPLDTPTSEPLPGGVSSQTIIGSLWEPVGLAVDPAGRIFYTQRSGAVRLIVNNVLQANPVITFSVDACPDQERGLVGLTLDPNFASNHYIYVYYTAYSNGNCSSTTNRVVRFYEHNGVGSYPVLLFSSPQVSCCHVGGNLRFGPDGKLYIAVGDSGNAGNAQDVTVPNGKIHRINPDGSIPADNPVFTQTGALPSLYTIGHRNPWNINFDTISTQLFSDENGPDCDDELNRIVGGDNYGWRNAYPCDDGHPSPQYNTIPPLWYVPTSICCIAPTGLVVYSGSTIPTWHNSLFMCSYNDSVLHHFTLSNDRTQVNQAVAVEGVACNLSLANAPNGNLYYIQGGGWMSGTLKMLHGTGPTPTTVPPPPTLTPGGPTPCPIQYMDVVMYDPFYSYIHCLSCRGILSGYSCGAAGEPCPGSYFHPAATVNRGQVAKMVANSAGYSDNIPSTRQTFGDVPYGSTYWLYVERVYAHGVISGYASSPPCPDGQVPCFLPGNPMTRGQIAKVDSNAANYQDAIPSTQQTFTDVPYGDPFWLYIERVALHGVISGYSTAPPCPVAPCYLPGNAVNRSQTAKIVANTFFPSCFSPQAKP